MDLDLGKMKFSDILDEIKRHTRQLQRKEDLSS